LPLDINSRELRGVKLIVPSYSGPDNPPFTPAGVSYFGHQYASDEDTAPFGPTDINQSRMTLADWLAAWGVNGGVEKAPAKRPPRQRRRPEKKADAREASGKRERADRPARKRATTAAGKKKATARSQ
jgi:hypothetical protein